MSARALLLAAAVAAAGCGRTEPDLLFVYSGDCRGLIEPCGCVSGRLGGLARRATVLEPLLRRHPSRLVVDAGGWSAMEPDKTELRSRFLLAGLRDLGLEVANVSMRDLRLGERVLSALAESTRVQFVSANVAADPAWLRPHVILSRSIGAREVRIGITGVTAGGDPGDAWTHRPLVDDPIAAAVAALEELSAQTDVQVLLAALPAAVLDQHVAEIGGFELLVSGSGDLREAQPAGAPPLVLSPGSQCKFAAWTLLRVRADGVLEPSGAAVEMLDGAVPDAPRWAARVAGLRRQLGAVAADSTAGSAAP